MDGHDASAFPDLLPDLTTGQITYDVDNDGDGVTDSVWIDLGFPVQTDETGKKYKPMFAFMVQGLNGKLPLNTAGNLAGRELADDPTTPNINELGQPTYNHTSNLGVSPSEINPRFALQAPFDVNLPAAGFGQWDNAGIDVSTTQLRNLLAGTRPQEFDSSNNPLNGDTNVVNNALLTAVERRVRLPAAEQRRTTPSDLSYDRSGVAPVAGRYGEAGGVPATTFVNDGSGNPVPWIYNNPVGAGRSVYSGGPIDGLDDDFDGLDFFPGGTAETGNFLDPASGLALPSERNRYNVTPRDNTGTGRTIAYNGEKINGKNPNPDIYYTFDVTINPATGGPWDYYRRGYGFDSKGRVGYLHYFRPPGVLPDVASPAVGGVTTRTCSTRPSTRRTSCTASSRSASPTASSPP